MKRLIIIITVTLFCVSTIYAQKEKNNTPVISETSDWEYELKAGFNIGGASPIPLPVEIRSIDNYNPLFNGSLEGSATHWFGTSMKWGASAGLKIENKGMKTGATVKNYSMEIIDGGSRISGYWTGFVHTKYSTSMVSIPIMANYRFNSRWKVRAGVYASYLFNKEFSGHVKDGYLREGTPIGEKLEFTDGKTATYNFDKDLRPFQWGFQIGSTWLALHHFTLNADLTWGMNNIFKSDFKTITFKLHPIYLNIGFGYRF
jgi:hypothetical protein